MNAKDQHKVIKFGFMIIRKEITHVVSHTYDRKIKYKSEEFTEWKTLEKDFESTAALERRMKELLKNPQVIED